MLRFYPKVPKGSKWPSIDGSSSKNVISSSNITPDVENNVKKPRIEVEISEDDIVGDPGLRKAIESYDVNIRKEVRRGYLTKGPTQPREFKFPQTEFSGCMRSFQKQWFEEFNWLEYCVAKDAAFCHLCYLFARGHKMGMMFLLKLVLITGGRLRKNSVTTKELLKAFIIMQKFNILGSKTKSKMWIMYYPNKPRKMRLIIVLD
ncbi:unnamed protein product [Cuscuta europaea]|uniref:Uncharacterized protein n=1 Tax=Cuscuta europaea TaxID=41803 RepID=A0A9P0YT74_CUSEU|nr:unnamed protein product [Cuscuta europaea]